MVDLKKETNKNQLDSIGFFEFIRVKVNSNVKYIITSGGDNPTYYLEQTDFEKALKSWKTIHRKHIVEIHKGHIEDVKEKHINIVEEEQNPRLPGCKDV